MEMNAYSLSCVMCLSWNLLFLTPCPRLICLEQSSLRICTKEHRVSSPSRKLLNTFTMSIKPKGSGMSVQASCSFHCLGNTSRNEGGKKRKGKVRLVGQQKSCNSDSQVKHSIESQRIQRQACYYQSHSQTIHCYPQQLLSSHVLLL